MSKATILSYLLGALLFACGTSASTFDGFNSSNTDNTANIPPWTAIGGSDRFHWPIIENNQIKFARFDSPNSNGRYPVKMQREITPSNKIGIDLKRDNFKYIDNDPDPFTFTVYDQNNNSVSIKLNDTVAGNKIDIRFLINGQEKGSILFSDKPCDYHTYEIYIPQKNKVTFKIDGVVKYTADGSIGLCTKAEISVNSWYRYLGFYADNFYALLGNDIPITAASTKSTDYLTSNSGWTPYGNTDYFKPNISGGTCTWERLRTEDTRVTSGISKNFSEDMSSVSVNLNKENGPQCNDETYLSLKASDAQGNTITCYIKNQNGDPQNILYVYKNSTFIMNQAVDNSNKTYNCMVVYINSTTTEVYLNSFRVASFQGLASPIRSTALEASRWWAWHSNLTATQYYTTPMVDTSIIAKSIVNDKYYNLNFPITNGVELKLGNYANQIIEVQVLLSSLKERNLNDKAYNKGFLLFNFGDICEIKLSYDLSTDQGEIWHSIRIPYSTSKVVKISCSDPQFLTLHRIRLFTQMPNSEPYGIEPNSSEEYGWKDKVINIPSQYNPTSLFIGVNNNWNSPGITDAFNDSTGATGTRDELKSKLAELGINAWRFPGGTGTYDYPESKAALIAYRTANLSEIGQHGDYTNWSSPSAFFRFCKLSNITPWYEINPGIYYNDYKNAVYSMPQMRHIPNNVNLNHEGILTDLKASVNKIVTIANTENINVVYEIGNEDYVWFELDEYAYLCYELINSLREVNSSVKVAVCPGMFDGIDNVWRNYFRIYMNSYYTMWLTRGIDYTSEHIYLWDRGAPSSLESMWNLTYNAPEVGEFLSNINKLEKYGINGSAPEKVLTEFNVYPPWIESYKIHTVGRAIGEAQVMTNNINAGKSYFMHELVAGADGSEGFARLGYYPNNPISKKYFMLPVAKAASIISKHNNGETVQPLYDGLYAPNGESNRAQEVGLVTIHRGNSESSKYLYITVCNKRSNARVATLTFNNITRNQNIMPTYSLFSGAAPDCNGFNYNFSNSNVDPRDYSLSTLTIKAPPFSVIGYTFYIR